MQIFVAIEGFATVSAIILMLAQPFFDVFPIRDRWQDAAGCALLNLVWHGVCALRS
jgi:hypothetical protein